MFSQISRLGNRHYYIDNKYYPSPISQSSTNFIQQLLQEKYSYSLHCEVSKMNEPPKYAYPYPAQGYYQGPPVMAPPHYYAAPPPRREPGFLEGCLAALCCCFLIDECCCDPSILFIC